MRHQSKTAPAPAAQLLSRAIALHKAGNLNGAEALYLAVLASEPKEVNALYQLGMVHAARGAWEECAEWMGKVVAVKRSHADAHYNRGVALEKLGRCEEALASYDEAIRRRRDYALAYNNRGVVLQKLGRPKEALISYDKAIALKPDFAGAHTNRGSALEELGRYEEALTSYDKAIALRPGFVEAINNRGLVLEQFHRYDEALASYDKAIALKPDHANAYWNKALLRILRGEYGEGWKLYEWRWKRSNYSGHRTLPKPQWTGESVAGKTILLHAEQGLGDTIQFARYVPMIKALGANILLEVHPSLSGLLSTLKGSAQIVAQGSVLPGFDLHCPLMSLPLAFATRIDTIPADIPYLSADPQKQKSWQDRLGEKRRTRVGLAWSGSPHHKNDRNRSIPPGLLSPLWGLDVEYHSLHKEHRPEDKAILAQNAIAAHNGNLHDFSDTAALIAAMDLVISVDTSVAHLAGAMGKPVWILLPFAPDYRWMTGREDSPWYPTARLLRQPAHGDWAGVIARVAAELGAL